jgi:hypothetical protein
VGAGLQHDPQPLATGKAPFEGRPLVGQTGFFHDLAGFIQHAHLDIAVPDVKTHG